METLLRLEEEYNHLHKRIRRKEFLRNEKEVTQPIKQTQKNLKNNNNIRKLNISIKNVGIKIKYKNKRDSVKLKEELLFKINIKSHISETEIIKAKVIIPGLLLEEDKTKDDREIH